MNIPHDVYLVALDRTAREYSLSDRRSVIDIKAVVRIVIRPNGEFITTEISESKTVPRKIFAKGNDKARFLIDKHDKVLGTEKYTEQHQVFVSQIKHAADATADAGLLSVLRFYKKLDRALKHKIAKEIERTMGSKYKFCDTTFALYGREHNSDIFTSSVMRWWKKEFDRQMQLRFSDCRKGICQISGKTDIIPHQSPLPPAACGQLLSANASTFEFGGHKGLSSSNIGVQSAINIDLAFEHIFGNNLKSQTTKFNISRSPDQFILSWFSKPVFDRHDEMSVNYSISPPKKEENLDIDFGEDEIWSHIDWIRSQYKGSSSTNRPDESQDYQYCTLLIEKNKGRNVIQEMSFLTISKLRSSILKWADDSYVERRYFDKTKNRIVQSKRLIPVKRTMHLLSGDVSKITSHVSRSVHRAFFQGYGLSKYFSVLNDLFRSRMYKDENIWDIIALQKLALIRKGINMPSKWSVETAEKSPAFAIGSILFLTAYAQHPETKGRESIIPSKFMTACTINPVRTNAPMLRYFTIYIERMRREKPGLAYLLQRSRDYLMTLVGDWPVSLTAVQQSELIVGFSLMREAIQCFKLSEIFPHLKPKETENVSDQERS